MRSLFSAEPIYTLDTCSFNEMFDEERYFNRKNFPGVWDGVSELIKKGEIISHREVYDEIMDGPYEDLQAWAKLHDEIFLPHDFEKETVLIGEMGARGFAEFVHQRKTKNNADPWLVAQAKTMRLKVITQEKKKSVRDLPRVCDEFTVPYLDIFGFVREKGWVLKRGI